MLRQRILVVIIILPIVIGLIYLGGWFVTGLALLAMLVCGWEYWRMFKNNGFAPSLPIILGGNALIVFSRHFFQFEDNGTVISAILIAAATVHLFQFEKGNQQAATNFAITVLGTIYIGWLCSYLISLGQITDGTWWTLLIIASTSLTDGGAYLFGMKWGKHKMNKRLSPKKSWEGYFGGIVFSIPLLALISLFWSARASSIQLLDGLIISLVISVFSVLADLSISMIKRQCGVKDTSRIIPGHGGVLDRIDTLLWTMPIGYYLIIWFFL